MKKIIHLFFQVLFFLPLVIIAQNPLTLFSDDFNDHLYIRPVQRHLFHCGHCRGNEGDKKDGGTTLALYQLVKKFPICYT